MFVTHIFCKTSCRNYEENGRPSKWATFLEAIQEKELMEDDNHFVRITLDPEFEKTLTAETLLGVLRTVAFKFNEEVQDTSPDEIIAYAYAEDQDNIRKITEETK